MKHLERRKRESLEERKEKSTIVNRCVGIAAWGLCSAVACDSDYFGQIMRVTRVSLGMAAIYMELVVDI